MINPIDHHDLQGTAWYNPGTLSGFEYRIEGAFPSIIFDDASYYLPGGCSVLSRPYLPSASFSASTRFIKKKVKLQD